MKPIDGHELLNELDRLLQDHEDEAYTAEDIRTTIMLMIKRAPTVSNVSAVHAHWGMAPTLFDEKDSARVYYCTNCHKARSLMHPDFRYCPYCGAKMEDKDETN